MKCRYTIARFVPDPIRDEPINVGVILQSDEFVGSKFIPRLPRSWIMNVEAAEELVPQIHDYWGERLKGKTEWIFMPEKGTKTEVTLTNKDFLVWLKRTYDRHIQFSEIRDAEVEVQDRFGFDGLLVYLYDTFVTPKPRARRVISGRARLHTNLRHDFQQLKLLDKIEEKASIEGTILWEVDFVYRNGYEVALLATDFNLRNLYERATNVLAAWSDLEHTRRDTVRRISVVGNYKQIPEHRKALQLIERYATVTFNYETEKLKLADMVIREVGSGRLEL